MILTRAGDPYDMGRIGVECPRLPFASPSLKPVLSLESVVAHYGQHRKYCNNVKRLIEDHNPELIDASLVEIIRHVYLKEPGVDLERQAGQAWNHAFLWLSLKSARSQTQIERMDAVEFADTALGSRYGGRFADLREELISTAASGFGSQWAWLVYQGDEVRVKLTHEAETPITEADVTPLLVVDLWEHAFFLDYHFDKSQYARQVVENLLDWDRANDLVTLELC